MFINSHSHALDSSNLFAFPARVEPISVPGVGGWWWVGVAGVGAWALLLFSQNSHKIKSKYQSVGKMKYPV